VPAKPSWHDRIDEIVANLNDCSLVDFHVDAQHLGGLLGVGDRAAQKIIREIPLAQRDGRHHLILRSDLVLWLRSVQSGVPYEQEKDRQSRLGRWFAKTEQEWRSRPRLFVEIGPDVLRTRLASLPSGVSVSGTRITVEFSSYRDAVEKLAALAIALANDREQFEEMTERPKARGAA